jgi:hypothetical protein
MITHAFASFGTTVFEKKIQDRRLGSEVGVRACVLISVFGRHSYAFDAGRGGGACSTTCISPRLKPLFRKPCM